MSGIANNINDIASDVLLVSIKPFDLRFNDVQEAPGETEG